MAKTIVINAKGKIKRAAVIEERSLASLFIDKGEKSSITGNIYLGKVQKVLPSIQAAFVDIGIGKNGFLHVSDLTSSAENGHSRKKSPDITALLKEGQEMLVQVAKDEIGTKGVRLVTQVSLPGRFLVLMPNGSGKVYLSRKIQDDEQRKYLSENVLPKIKVSSNVDVIIRTAAAGVKFHFVKRDLENLLQIWKSVEESQEKSNGIALLHEELDLVLKVLRDWLDEEVQNVFIDDASYFEAVKQFIKANFAQPNVKIRHFRENIDIFDKFGITRQIEKLYNKRVWLECGGYIIIDKTEALVAIDVNTGRNTKHENSDETILETNLQAAKEIARQLHLRNMGGIVIIDFIDMRNRNHQRQVLRTLFEYLKLDKAKTRVFPFTRLGLVQMTRQRVEEAWEQYYFDDCQRCGGTGRILTVPIICEQLISKMKRFLVLHPAINLNVKASAEVLEFIESNKLFDEIEKRFGIEIGFLKDPDFHPEKFIVVRTDTGANIIRYDH